MSNQISESNSPSTSTNGEVSTEEALNWPISVIMREGEQYCTKCSNYLWPPADYTIKEYLEEVLIPHIKDCPKRGQ